MRRKKSKAVPTQHAMLVAWGEYAQQIGLVEQVTQVSLGQKTRTHSPQRKVLEALVGTLAGLPHLQDISRSAHPLDQDTAVAQAWGQEAWADYSGVSRTMKALTMAEVNQVIRGLQVISKPFVDEEVTRSLGQEGRLIYDGDLTGLPVSKSSQTYPNVAYGHMDDAICLGYQAAVVSLRSPTYGRLWLSIEHHPGNTISSQQAEALVLAAEACTGRRPWRRTDLLEERLQQKVESGRVLQKRLDDQQMRLAQVQAKLDQTKHKLHEIQSLVAQLEQKYQARNRPERPTSQLALARKRLEIYQKRLERRELEVPKAQRPMKRTQERLQQHQVEQGILADRLAQFQQENAENTNPLQATFRLDAGFGTWKNLALLIEMGYEVFTKAFSPQTVQVLHKQFAKPEDWIRVGERAEMSGIENCQPNNFYYSVDVGLLHFTTSDGRLKKGAMLHFGTTPVTKEVQQWFDFFNGRQTIEAGIKESKQVFYLHRFKVRSEPAIILQEHFVLFAANFIRWANVWLMNHSTGSAKDALDHAKLGTKRLVSVAAHTSADVIWFSDGCFLRFSDLSLLAGKDLFLPRQPDFCKNRLNNFVFFQCFRRFAKWLHNT